MPFPDNLKGLVDDDILFDIQAGNIVVPPSYQRIIDILIKAITMGMATMFALSEVIHEITKLRKEPADGSANAPTR